MMEATEIAPGIYRDGGGLFLCPACGLAYWGEDHMNRANVLLWLLAVLTLLQVKGVKNADPQEAARLADEWVSGGYKTHKEGGHDAQAD